MLSAASYAYHFYMIFLLFRLLILTGPLITPASTTDYAFDPGFVIDCHYDDLRSTNLNSKAFAMDFTDFVRADSTNLPKVDPIMLMEFMKNSDKHNIAEIRGVKALMSSRESYVDSAVGYVEVKRAGNLCDVKAKVVPEHKLSNKYYNTVVQLDEKENTIIDTTCDGCAAAAGGCKHTLVLLYWLQKRSSEPSTTSVECYWVKPSLKRAQEEVLNCKELFKCNNNQVGPKDPEILKKFCAEARSHACSRALILTYDNSSKSESLSSYCLFDLMLDFVVKENDYSYKKFKTFCNEITETKKNKISKETKSQVHSKLWHCIRQGRITGSKIYEVAHCKTPDGSLVQELLGGHKVPETKAMKRGKVLEKSIIKKLQQELNEEIVESGFILIDGLFGASPDGITNDLVIEIKCPVSDKTTKNYINNGQISNKCMGQVQLEMLAAKKQKCLFCVADPNFEQNGEIKKIIIDFDENYIKNLMNAAEAFWEQNIFPKMLKSAII